MPVLSSAVPHLVRLTLVLVWLPVVAVQVVELLVLVRLALVVGVPLLVQPLLRVQARPLLALLPVEQV